MKLNEKSKQIIFEIVPIILFALALVIRFAVDIERLQWGLMEVAAILWLVDNLEKYKKEHTIPVQPYCYRRYVLFTSA